MSEQEDEERGEKELKVLPLPHEILREEQVAGLAYIEMRAAERAAVYHLEQAVAEVCTIHAQLQQDEHSFMMLPFDLNDLEY